MKKPPAPVKNVSTVSGDRHTTINVFHNSATPQTVALPAPVVAAPKPQVRNVGGVAASRIADWRSRAPQRKAALLAARILKKAGSPLGTLDAVVLGRLNFPKLAEMVRGCSLWPTISDRDRATIESALAPVASPKGDTLEAIRASLSADDLKLLSPQDRVEILTGVASENLLRADHLPLAVGKTNCVPAVAIPSPVSLRPSVMRAPATNLAAMPPTISQAETIAKTQAGAGGRNPPAPPLISPSDYADGATRWMGWLRGRYIAGSTKFSQKFNELCAIRKEQGASAAHTLMQKDLATQP